MQMQQHNGIIILIQKSTTLGGSRSSSYIIRPGNRNIKRAGGVLHMLSLMPLSRTLLKHGSKSTGIDAVILVHGKEESGFPCVEFFDYLCLARGAT